MLKIDANELSDRQIELTVEVPEERTTAAMRSAAKRLGKGAKIPGFRPGKAPYEVIVSKYGEEMIFEEALETLGQEIYREALETQGLEPYAPGSLDDVQNRDPLVLKYTVPLPPEVDLGDYREIRIPYKDPEITDEAVEEALEDLRQRQALIEPVERPAEDSDVVILDIQGELLEIGEDEDPILIDTQGISILVDEETDYPFEGIYQHLVGLSEGDEKEIEHTFADDYPSEDLRGRNATFQLKCQGVRSRLVPEWSDDLATNLGEFESLLDLRVKMRESLTNQAKRTADSEYSEQVMETVLEGATIQYPPVVMEEELNHAVRDFESRLNTQNLTLEDYLKIENQTEEELRSELEPTANERAKRGLVLGKVVELEKLDTSEEEVSARIDEMLEPLGEQSDQALRGVFDTPQGRSRIAVELLTEKAMERLMTIARGEFVEPEEPVEETPVDESDPTLEPIEKE